MKKIYKYTLIISGFFSLFLGIIGIFLPILPTTPFVLLSGICFAHSSPKIYDKLINMKYLGKLISDYRAGKGLSKSAIIFSILLLWLMMLISILFVVKLVWLKILLIAIGLAVSVHILFLGKKK